MAIEQYIKQKFENFQPQPPQHVWTKIQARVAKPWYKTTWFNSIIAIITIATISISVFQIKSNNHKTTYTIESIKTPNFNTVIFHEITSTQKQNQKQVKNSSSHKTKTSIISEEQLIKQDIDSDNKITTIQNDTAKEFNFYPPYEKKKLNFKISINPHQGCAPLKVKMSVEPPENMNVSWFVDQKPISDNNNVEYILDQGTHFILLAIFDTMQTILVYDTVIVYPKPSAAFDAEKCKAGDTLSIKNLSINANSYQWNFGDGQIQTECNPVHIYTNPGLYKITLIASNDHCSDTAHKTINVEKKEAAIIFPNAFVPDINGPSGGYYNPNKPQVNVFHPRTNKAVKEYNLKIFDRRGKLIFETNDINRGWDGYYRNKLVPIGVYIYIAQGRFEDGEPFTVKGDITVIYRR